MYEKVFAYLDAHAEDYAAQLCRWVEVPSVKGEATPGAPFGRDVRRMLDMAMADAKAFGYETRDFDGYACDITLPGESEEAIAVLGHLDVVPAGDNWATPPFTATRVGDQIFARGTSDDKGPALAALYAMNAIKAAGIPLKKSIRLILGCDEESDWEDMAYYCAHTEMPEVGFSPDASFPIINTEKGMIHGFFTSKLAEDGLQVKQLWTGERVNVIPGESKALIAGGQEVADKVAAYAEKTGLPYTAEVTADGVWVTAEGIPGHSAYPEGRRNAIGRMPCCTSARGNLVEHAQPSDAPSCSMPTASQVFSAPVTPSRAGVPASCDGVAASFGIRAVAGMPPPSPHAIRGHLACREACLFGIGAPCRQPLTPR